MKKEKRKLDDTDMAKINLGLDMDTDILSMKKRLSMIMFICIKQHLSNIWGSVYDKDKQHWDWVKKRRCL